MNDEPCVLQINNTNYYVACNSLEYVVYDESNNILINTSNSSITMYKNYPVINDSTSGYPRVIGSANQVFYYRSSSQSGNSSLTVSQFKIVNRHTSDDFMLMLVLIGVCVINLFKR